jgi:hypothetical protein
VHYAKDFEEMHFIPYPDAYVISLLNKNIKGKVLETKFSSPETYVSAVKDGVKIKVIVCNIDKKRVIKINFNNFSNLKYIENESLGINVPENFTVMDYGASIWNPGEVRLLNIIKDSIKITQKGNYYEAMLPQNTLCIFVFNQQQ